MMWTKFEIMPSDESIIYFPVKLSVRLSQTISLYFGKRSTRAKVEYSTEISADGEGSFSSPGIIRITKKVKDDLLIPDNLIYQVKLYFGRVVIGPVIGLLLGVHGHVYNPRHMKKYSDRFGVYSKIGGLIYAFSPEAVDWKNHIAHGIYYNIVKSSWEYGTFPLPDAIYRRDFHSDAKAIKMLIGYTEGRLFNSYRFTKYELHNFLQNDETMRKHLLPTELSLNYQQAKTFIDMHNKIIFKPVDLSRGRGICIFEKNGPDYKVFDYRKKKPVELKLDGNKGLEKFFEENSGLFKSYLMQKFIFLARINDSCFDVRVVMQKQYDRMWRCTGIECRVSGEGVHITNISRGGHALPLQKALYGAFPVNCDYNLISEQIDTFCNRFCTYMDSMGEHFAEFGIDIGLDQDKNIWLIEANVFPSFKGFKKMDYKTYLAIRHTPLLYALSLTEFGDCNIQGG